jgi:hypothetical protein
MREMSVREARGVVRAHLGEGADADFQRGGAYEVMRTGLVLWNDGANQFTGPDGRRGWRGYLALPEGTLLRFSGFVTHGATAQADPISWPAYTVEDAPDEARVPGRLFGVLSGWVREQPSRGRDPVAAAVHYLGPYDED